MLAISGAGRGSNCGKSRSLTCGKQSMAPLSSVGRRPLSTHSPSAKRRKLSSVGAFRGSHPPAFRCSRVPGFGVAAPRQPSTCKSPRVAAQASSTRTGSGKSPTHKSTIVAGPGVARLGAGKASTSKSSIVVAGFGVSGPGTSSTSAGPGKSSTQASSTGVPGSGVDVRARRGVLATALRQTPSAALIPAGRVDPGPVHETRKEHAARHPVRHPGCIRCVYAADQTKLEAAYGSHQHEQAGDDPGLVRRTVWLAPRPCRLGAILLSVAFSVLICGTDRKAMHRVLVHGPLANTSFAPGMPIRSGRASNRQMQNNLLHEDCGNTQTPPSIKLQFVHISHLT